MAEFFDTPVQSGGRLFAQLAMLIVAVVMALAPVERAYAVPIPISLEVTPDNLGTGWEQTQSPGFIREYQIAATQPHQVTVTLSDQTKEVFAMVISSPPSSMIPFSLNNPVTAAFAAGAGVTSSLELTRDTLAVKGGATGAVTLLDGLSSAVPFDPQSYLYTQRDHRGTVLGTFTLPKDFGSPASGIPRPTTLIAAAVPEPSTLGLLGVGLLGLVVLRRKFSADGNSRELNHRSSAGASSLGVV